MNPGIDVVFSADTLLRDARKGEHATSGGKRWTEGFQGRDIGHNNYGWPVFAVTAEVATMLVEWSVRNRTTFFTQCRTWHSDDQEALRAAESMTVLYEWNGCYLTTSWRSTFTDQTHCHTALQLVDGCHVVFGHSWMQVPPDLVDVVHCGPLDDVVGSHERGTAS